MRTKVLSDATLARLRRHPAIYRVLRRGRFAVGRFTPRVSVPGIPGRLHRNDFMLGGSDEKSIRNYVTSGRSDLDAVERAVVASGVVDLSAKRWLEVGCGYGRVVRFLTERVPATSVWVTDVLSESVEFCEQELGVNGINDLRADGALDASFDVIYLISVLTHLPLASAAPLIETLTELLAPGGVLVVTTHGPELLVEPGRYGPELAAQKAGINEDFDRVGACYRPYSHSKDDSYGVAWHSESYLRMMVTDASKGRLAAEYFAPRGLSGHQDVYAFRAA
jgi:SAM-dependent methyltransferase